MDILTPRERSKVMGLVKSKNTKPEMKVRRALFALGMRYRLHDNKLPGHPDLVFKKYKTVVFIHGCFWHRHPGCKKTRTPKTNSIFWENKFELNIARDKLILDKYSKLGWNVIIVWECEIETTNKLQETILNTIDKIINNYN